MSDMTLPQNRAAPTSLQDVDPDLHAAHRKRESTLQHGVATGDRVLIHFWHEPPLQGTFETLFVNFFGGLGVVISDSGKEYSLSGKAIASIEKVT